MQSPQPRPLVASVARVARDRDAALHASWCSSWGAEDWKSYFDERAAIAEYGDGVSRSDADQTAFEWCVALWLDGASANAKHDDYWTVLGDTPGRIGAAPEAADTQTGTAALIRRKPLTRSTDERRATAVAALRELGVTEVRSSKRKIGGPKES